jgi:multiple antibiotic resistance protein
MLKYVFMEILLNTFVVLFIVIDPVGLAPMFIALTPGASPAYQRKMAFNGTLLASGMLLVFYFLGDTLLNALGIGIPAFRIAGGALLFLLAIDMVFARQSGLRSTTTREQQEAETKQDISVFPLAFPLIAGPGALTTVLLMSTTAKSALVFGGVLVLLVVVLGITLVSLLYATRILKFLGETGTNVISRVFGLILAALAVQYILDGIHSSFTG